MRYRWPDRPVVVICNDGGDPAYLSAQADKFIAAARKRPEIGRVSTLYRASVPQIYADIDRSKVLKSGLAISDVNTTLGALLGSSYVNDFNRFGRVYKVYMQAEPEFRKDPWFGFDVPVAVEGVDSAILDPQATWGDKRAYAETAAKLVKLFTQNFARFEAHVDQAVLDAAPRLVDGASPAESVVVRTPLGSELA